MSGSDTQNVRLDLLPAPTVIESLDFDQVFAEIKADILLFDPSLELVLALESEPITILAQAFAYRIVKERQAANEKARAIMLAKARGPELDHLGALPWLRTPRKTLVAANQSATPPVPAVLELDDDYRLRLQTALDGWSVAGPVGAYRYHALRADSKVKDVGIRAPRFVLVELAQALRAQLPSGAYVVKSDIEGGAHLPGDVVIAVLSTDGNGTPTAATLGNVQSVFDAEDIVPMSDRPVVIAVAIKPYTVRATVYFPASPDRQMVINLCEDRAAAYAASRHRCGLDVALSGLYGALHQTGIQRVQLHEPTADILTAWNEAAYCTGIELTDGGTDA